MKKKKTISVAQHLGKGLAYIQDTTDIMVMWGAKKLKDTEVSCKKDAPKAAHLFKRTTNATFKFFGEFGESFYKEYERLKKQRNTKP
ncbi:MAG: hypothetical protein P1V18_01870 [Candidatus Gracilibacteria bacterium]|nr:hypothetical protein [Candidatus Gracilibacteria bacterium]